MAAWTDSIDALQLLIDAGAQLNLQDADGDTPLSNAAHQGNLRAVQVLLKAGADPRIANLVSTQTRKCKTTSENRMFDGWQYPWPVAHVDGLQSGNTPADTARAHGHQEIATLLTSFQ
mmetsp:Transcript_25350/g.51618  ORF Transcript_25350/g.51618 Transcript_25350/m.51618 type:complete len:118 (-) Transcript_25350:48-401(-)